MLRNHALKIHIDESDWKRTTRVDVGTISATDFNLTEDEKVFLLKRGRKGTLESLHNYNVNLDQPRKSKHRHRHKSK